MHSSIVSSADSSAVGSGLLVLRLILGLLMAAHGSQKLLGWFGGHGLAGTGQFFDQLGFRPGRAFAAAAALSEVGAALLIVLGLLGPVGPALMVSVMIVAGLAVHGRHGLFAMTNGIEVPLLYATAGVALALTGPGRYSLDALLGLTPLWTPAVEWGAIAAGIVGAIANLALRRPAPQAQAADAAHAAS